MKNIIVCDSNINKKDIEGYKVVIDGYEYLFALLDIPVNKYTDKISDQSVVVRVSAFSCNYRAKGILYNFLKKCKDYNLKESYYYSFLGSEFVGKVIKIGRNVRSFKIGDRVMSDNSYPFKVDGKIGGIVSNYASKRIQIFHESCLIKVPDSMSDIEAAAFSLTASTAHSMVSKSKLKEGDKVLVTSLFSNTSLGCLELLKNISGIKIYGLTTGYKEAQSLSEKFKIQKIFTPDDFYTATNKMNINFNVIIDPFPDIHINYLHSYLNYSSRYISCGMSSHQNEKIDFYKILYSLIVSNSQFIGNCLGLPYDLKAVINEYSHERYKVYVDSVYTGRQISDFINKSFNERHFGKVVYSYE